MSPKPVEKKKLLPIKIEGAKVIYKNFSGTAKEYNAAGLRNFHVVIDNEWARKLAADGWNIKWHEPKKEGDELWASLKVNVRFDNYPPAISMFANGKRKMLDEDTVGLLDDAETDNIDLVITASYWTRPNGSGFKAYLKKMYVDLSPHDLEAKHMLKKEADQSPVDDD